MKKLAIVILNWNGKKLLEKFLPTLLATVPSYADLIIADNCSHDNSIPFLKEHYPNISLILLDQNYGFATGYNKALMNLEHEYFCLLNSDIEVTPNWISPIMEAFESDDTLAIAQPKILAYHNKSTFEYAGAAGGFLDYLGYPFCRGRVFNHLEEDKGQYDTPQEIFWASGAALFVKASIYQSLKGLDDDFFAHMEEIDFCWRVKNNGKKIVVIPQSTVYHVGGGTLPQNNPFKTYLNFRNNLFLLLKNLPEKHLKQTFFKRFFLDYLAAFVFLLKGNSGDFKAVFRARRDFKKQYSAMKAKRGTCSEEVYRELYPKSLVLAFHLHGKRIFDGKTLHN